MLPQAKWPTEDLGIVRERVAARERFDAWRRRRKEAPEQPPAPRVIVRPEPMIRIPKVPMIHRDRRRMRWRRVNTPRLEARVKDVIRVAAEAFGVTPEEMMTCCRERRLARPRFAAMHLMRSILRISLPSIGKVFKRDHTSVMHGLARVAQLRRDDRDFAYRSRAMARELRRRWSVAGQAETQE